MLLIGLGTTAGIAAMALVLWPALKRARVHLHFVPKLRHAAVRTMLRLSGWTVGYVIANQIALWVVLVLANGKRGGAFAYLAAYAFFQLPHGLFAVSIMTTVQPELASAVARGDRPALRHRFARGLRLILVVVIPAAGLYVGLARPIVVALLQRGAFSAHDASLVADTLVGLRRRTPRVLRVPLRPARVLLAARHAHALRPELLRERGEHRPRARALPRLRHSRAGLGVLGRLHGRGAL